MKKQLIESVVIFSGLLLFLAGCLVNPPKHNMEAKYKKAMQLENTGNFYFKEGEADSALKSYRKSLGLYTELADSTPAEKDTLYKQTICYIYSCISCVYDTLHNYDSALAYNIKSLNLLTKWQSEIRDREILNHNIALDYKQLGNLKGNETEAGKALYRKGIPYAQAACWEIDSLGDHSENALWAYHLAMGMYTITGDTIHTGFYKTKYTELYNALYPANMQAKTPQASVQQATKKTSATEQKPDKDTKDEFINAFKRGFERGWNKHHHSSNEYNSSNTTVSTTTNSNGTVTTITTTISGNEETIVTEVNGVVVKKETKKLY